MESLLRCYETNQLVIGLYDWRGFESYGSSHVVGAMKRCFQAMGDQQGVPYCFFCSWQYQRLASRQHHDIRRKVMKACYWIERLFIALCEMARAGNLVETTIDHWT
jgi:hypothetical protein